MTTQDPGPRPNRGKNDMRGPALSAPTPSLHPSVVSHLEGFNEETGPYVQPALEAFEAAHKGIQSVIDARKKVSEATAWSPEKRLLEIATLAERTQEKATKAFDSARTRLLQGLTSLEESLNKPLTQDANAGSINGEVRAHMKGLTSEQRQQLLDDAFKNRDETTLRAALSAPGYLTGITEDERKLRVKMFHRMTQPAIAQRADVMRKAVELIERNGPLLFGQVEGALGGKGSWAMVQQARTKLKAAEDALKIA